MLSGATLSPLISNLLHGILFYSLNVWINYWFWLGIRSTAREQSGKAFTTRAGVEKSTSSGAVSINCTSKF